MNKRAAIGETITWLVATIIITIVLSLAILISGLIWKHKEVQSPYFQSTDVLASKSYFSYILTEDSAGETIYSQLKKEDNLNDVNGNFGARLFRSLYQEDYADDPDNIWLGLLVKDDENFLNAVSNSYFGRKPGAQRGTEESFHVIPHISEKITLGDDKLVELMIVVGK